MKFGDKVIFTDDIGKEVEGILLFSDSRELIFIANEEKTGCDALAICKDFVMKRGDYINLSEMDSVFIKRFIKEYSDFIKYERLHQKFKDLNIIK